MPQMDGLFDELVIWKGLTPYTEEFTPPVNADETGVPVAIEGDTKDVYQPNNYPLLSLCADIADISKVDFRITTQFKIFELYTWITSAQTQKYYVVGQWTQNPDDTALLGGNYWCIYLRVNSDYTIDAVFEVYDNGVLVTQLVHETSIKYNDEGGVSTLDTSGWSEGWITIAVERHNDVVALWTSDYDEENTGTETIGVLEDFTTPTGDLQINGLIGGEDGGEYSSVTAEKNLRIWTSFTPVFADGNAYEGRSVILSEDFFNLGEVRGLVFFPRLYPILQVGEAGDIRMLRSGFYPRIKSTLRGPVKITSSLAFPLTMKSNMAYLGELHPGLTLYKPPFEIKFSGAVEVLGSINVTLPAWTMFSEGDISTEGTLQFKIPALIPSLLGFEDFKGGLEVNIPAYRFSGKAIVNEIGTLAVTLPALRMGGDAQKDIFGVITLEIPKYAVALSGYSSIEGVLSVALPSLSVDFYSTLSDDTFDSMVMNTKNKALTLYKNYKYNSMCQFNGVPLGATKSGIFNLNSGDDDSGTHIDWNIKTGLIDLEQVSKKKLQQAWISYKTNGDIMFTVVIPDGTEYEYSLDGIDDTETGLRVKFGKGIRSKYLALDIESIDGCSFALDELKLHFQQTKKAR